MTQQVGGGLGLALCWTCPTFGPLLYPPSVYVQAQEEEAQPGYLSKQPGATEPPGSHRRGTREHSLGGGKQEADGHSAETISPGAAPRGGLGASCRVGVASGPGSKPLDLPFWGSRNRQR